VRKRWEESRVRVLEDWDDAMRGGGFLGGATMEYHEALWTGGVVYERKPELKWRQQ
jgi:hypothetical protein